MGSARKVMDTTPPIARWSVARTPTAAVGLALVAVAAYWAIVSREPILAAIVGAGGLQLLRTAFSERPYAKALVVADAAAFAIFAFQRNDGLGFWQLPGPWADVFRFNVPGATIALTI